MGNVNLPTPVAVAGAAICLLAGYLIGMVTGSDAPTRSTGEVVSYDGATSELCLGGEGVQEQEGAIVDGVLCGTWRRPAGSSRLPEKGESFRFVSLSAGDAEGPQGQRAATVIYGEVVG
ncbi:hypothetical protein [Nocardioides mesophilus]|uniref:Uncharacterized protein n=1 Tax=Nocardioides mesophilus TaxID=433659 RepID=A0A7G9RA45_9ACTN|nr:hypothetical protein [Nocardioides mesophilus]QNN52470.1 hypothetical protein H9L09_18655 [Nocardioides mesophilus]